MVVSDALLAASSTTSAPPAPGRRRRWACSSWCCAGPTAGARRYAIDLDRATLAAAGDAVRAEPGLPMLEMPAIVFRDAVVKNMFGHAGISKRCAFVASNHDDLRRLGAIVTHLDRHELGLLPGLVAISRAPRADLRAALARDGGLRAGAVAAQGEEAADLAGGGGDPEAQRVAPAKPACGGIDIFRS